MRTTRIVTTGGRFWRGNVGAVLAEYGPCVFANGACPTGADRLVSHWVRAVYGPSHLMLFPANWALGKRAGPLRNEQMIATFKPDLVVAFPGDRGTANCVEMAHKYGVPVRIVSVPTYTKEFEHTCAKCRTVMAVTKEDVKFHDGDQREGSYVDFGCPTCRTRQCVNTDHLPFGFLL